MFAINAQAEVGRHASTSPFTSGNKIEEQHHNEHSWNHRQFDPNVYTLAKENQDSDRSILLERADNALLSLSRSFEQPPRVASSGRNWASRTPAMTLRDDGSQPAGKPQIKKLDQHPTEIGLAEELYITQGNSESSFNRTPDPVEALTFGIPTPSVLKDKSNPNDAGNNFLVEPSIQTSNQMHVRVLLPRGVTTYVDISPQVDTIADLKRKVCQRETDIKPHQLDVIYNALPLQDNWMVIDCGIQRDGKVHLRHKGGISHIDGTSWPAETKSIFAGGAVTTPLKPLAFPSDSALLASENSSARALQSSLLSFSHAEKLPRNYSTIRSAVIGPSADSSTILPTAHNLASIDTATASKWQQKVRPEEVDFFNILRSSPSYSQMVDDLDFGMDNTGNTDGTTSDRVSRLIKDFIVVCHQNIAENDSLKHSKPSSKLEQSISRNDALRQERNTWDLLLVLAAAERAAAAIDLGGASHISVREKMMDNGGQDGQDLQRISSIFYPGITAGEVIDDLLQKDSNLQRLLAVKDWLERIAAERIVITHPVSSKHHGVDGEEAAVMWRRTVRALKTNRATGGMVRSVDPDAPLRGRNGTGSGIGSSHLPLLHPDDEEDELDLVRSIWTHIRAGKQKDIMEYCRQAGHWWRAALLGGGDAPGSKMVYMDMRSNEEVPLTNEFPSPEENYIAPRLKRWGNPYRSLWKSLCWKYGDSLANSSAISSSALSHSSTPSGSNPVLDYEKLIYACLSGNLRSILSSPLANTWEDHTWAYFHLAIERRIDECLYALLQKQLQVSKYIPGGGGSGVSASAPVAAASSSRLDLENLKRTEELSGIDSESIFRKIDASPSSEVRGESNLLMRRIQAAFICGDNFDEIVTNILYPAVADEDREVLAGAQSEEENLWNLYLGAPHVAADNLLPETLRFMAHLVLALRPELDGSRPSDIPAWMVIKAYIRHLAQHRQTKLVAFYTSKLPPSGRICVFVEYCMSILAPADRVQCLELANDLFYTEVAEITRQIVEKTRVSSGLNTLILASADSDESDSLRLGALQWLCFNPEHRAQGLLQGNLLMRDFIRRDKLSAAATLFSGSVLPDDSVNILNQYPQTLNEDTIDLVLAEHSCWKVYINAVSSFSAWRQFMSEHSTRRFGYNMETLHELDTVVNAATEAIGSVLTYADGWMTKLSPGPDAESGADLRRLCLPHLMKKLHQVLYESGKWLLTLESTTDIRSSARALFQKSLRVADIAADSTLVNFSALSPDQSRQLLEQFAKSATAILQLENELVVC